MTEFINHINKSIKREEAKRAFICEAKSAIDRIERNIEWSKAHLLKEDGTESDYYKETLQDETERLEIYKLVFNEICEKIIEL